MEWTVPLYNAEVLEREKPKLLSPPPPAKITDKRFFFSWECPFDGNLQRLDETNRRWALHRLGQHFQI